MTGRAARGGLSSAAHLTHFGWAAMSQPLNNLASVLRSRGYLNTLHRPAFEYAHSERIATISRDRPFDRVHLHRLDSRFSWHGRRAARIVGLSDADWVAVDFWRKTGRKIHEQLLIGYDESGASMAWMCSRFTARPYIVFSLELTEHRHASPWEQMAWRNALAVITFDRGRAEILEDQYRLRPGSTICIPNSSIGSSHDVSGGELRSRLGIPEEKHIVLMVGTLLPEHGLHEIVRSVPSWPERFVLVMHGWGMDPAHLSVVDEMRMRCPDRIFLSTELLPQEHKHQLFSSADIGLVAFTDKTINHRFAGASAGKLFDFCQAGKPVIASALPGMRELVEGNAVGRVVERFEGIGDILTMLIARKSIYKEACHRFFEKNEFSLQMGNVLDSLGL